MMGRFNRPHRSNRIPAFIKMGWVQPPHFSVSKVAICSFGIKNMAQNFVLCNKNIMFAQHNKSVI